MGTCGRASQVGPNLTSAPRTNEKPHKCTLVGADGRTDGQTDGRTDGVDHDNTLKPL